MKVQSIKLCCGNKGCPVVSSNKKKVQIKDDYGNEVTITNEEAKLLGPAIEKLLTD
jgi:hypothetical protein